MDKQASDLSHPPQRWLTEFICHWTRFPTDLRIHLRNLLSGESAPLQGWGLFKFGTWLHDLVMGWTGVLDAELVYLATKVLVLAEMPDKAEDVARGFKYHLGCSAWLVGAMFRRTNGKVTAEVRRRLDDLEETAQWKSDQLVWTEVVAWQIAYAHLDDGLELYEAHKGIFQNGIPLAHLVDQLVRARKLEVALNYLGKKDDFQNDRLVNARLLNKQAVIFQLLGNQDKAFLFFDMAREVAESLGDVSFMAKLAFNQGASYFYQGNYEVALQLFQEANKFYKSTNDKTGLMKIYLNLCSVYNAIGDYYKAERSLSIIETLAAETANHSMLKSVQAKKSDIYRVRGEYEKATQILLDSLTTKESVVNAYIFIQLALVEQELGHFNNALLHLEKAYEMSEAIGHLRGQAMAELRMGQILLQQGKIFDGRCRLESALEIQDELKNSKGWLQTLLTLSYLDFAEGKLQDAESNILSVLEASKRQKEFSEEVAALVALAEVQLFKGNEQKTTILLETADRVLTGKKVRNYLYFNSKVVGIKARQNAGGGFDETLLLITDLTQLGIQAGAQVWVNTAKLFEAEVALETGELGKAGEILDQLVGSTDVSFELATRAKLLQAKVQIISESRNTNPDQYRTNQIEKQIIEVLDDSMRVGSKIWMLESKITLLLHYAYFKEGDITDEVRSTQDLLRETQLRMYEPQLELVLELLERKQMFDRRIIPSSLLTPPLLIPQFA